MGMLLAFLNGCAISQPQAGPMAVAPGGTAFSSGYSGNSQGSGKSEKKDISWPTALLGVGFLAAFIGGCFVMESGQGQRACFSVLEAFLTE